MADIIKIIDKYLNENSTDDCLKTLKACIKFYEGQEELDDKGEEVLDTLKGILDYYNENKSFSPGQAKAVFNISKGIEKITK